MQALRYLTPPRSTTSNRPSHAPPATTSVNQGVATLGCPRRRSPCRRHSPAPLYRTSVASRAPSPPAATAAAWRGRGRVPIAGWSLGGVGPGRGLHIISARPSKQPLMVRTEAARAGAGGRAAARAHGDPEVPRQACARRQPPARVRAQRRAQPRVPGAVRAAGAARAVTFGTHAVMWCADTATQCKVCSMPTTRMSTASVVSTRLASATPSPFKNR
jgi:hypothetical protein